MAKEIPTWHLRNRVHHRAVCAGVQIEDSVVERLCLYIHLLMRWNSRMNLTGLDDNDVGIDRLIVEPLMVSQFLSPEGSLVDIGSGGGSPAIPLKIAVPKLALRMVEPKTRKAAFLREAVRQLGLEKTAVETARYEQLMARRELHEAHDVMTVRAVSIEPKSLQVLQTFLVPGGKMLLFRSRDGDDIATDLEEPLVREAQIPLLDGLRSCLVVLRKGSTGANKKQN